MRRLTALVLTCCLVAPVFALAVTHPSAGNIDGGGFMLIH
jgi:gamma-glutamyltranspeptidase